MLTGVTPAVVFSRCLAFLTVHVHVLLARSRSANDDFAVIRALSVIGHEACGTVVFVISIFIHGRILLVVLLNHLDNVVVVELVLVLALFSILVGRHFADGRLRLKSNLWQVAGLYMCCQE
jgi:hypothetical protein